MSLARYRYFFKVARLGSIRAASEALHVAPSAISRQIARLEDELGVDLIEANGRGIRITPAGEILAGRASQIVDAVEQVRSDIDDLLGLRRRHVRIRTVEGSLNDLSLDLILAQLVSDLRARGLLEADELSERELALLLIDTYERYPEPVSP